LINISTTKLKYKRCYRWSHTQVPEDMWYPCIRRMRNAIEHVSISMRISSSFCCQDLQQTNPSETKSS
jgi:hypothetical protein